MGAMGRIAVWLAMLGLSGCAVQIASLPFGSIYNIQPKHGILMMKIATNVNLIELSLEGVINGKVDASDLRNGEYLFLELPAGAYELTQVKWKPILISLTKGNITLDLTGFQVATLIADLKTTDYKHWEFLIKPGVVNYVGDLILEDESLTRYVKIVLLNRSSFAQQYLEGEKFPFREGPVIRYAGFGEDRFFQNARKLFVQGRQP